MIEGLIGTKVGMTQLFDEDGTLNPVTVIQVGPCVVVQRKTVEVDGYDAIQVGLVDAGAAKRAKKPMRGHHEKAGVPPTRLRREFAVPVGGETKPGDALTVEMFNGINLVDVIGTSKGKGFQGVIKRHHFGGGRASHGSNFHRAPGSIGQSSQPSKVLKGMRGPGQMGNVRSTVKNLKVKRIDAEKGLLIVEGSIPGAPGSIVTVRISQKANRQTPTEG